MLKFVLLLILESILMLVVITSTSYEFVSACILFLIVAYLIGKYIYGKMRQDSKYRIPFNISLALAVVGSGFIVNRYSEIQKQKAIASIKQEIEVETQEIDNLRKKIIDFNTDIPDEQLNKYLFASYKIDHHLRKMQRRSGFNEVSNNDIRELAVLIKNLQECVPPSDNVDVHINAEMLTCYYEAIKEKFQEYGEDISDDKIQIADPDTVPSIYKSGKLYGFQLNGQIVVPAKYEDAKEFLFGESYVKLNGKIGIIGIKGQELIECKYDDLCEANNDINPQKGKVYKAVINGKYGLITSKKDTLIKFGFYDEITCFSENHATVKKNNKYSFVDSKGMLICPLVFDDASVFFNHYAVVGKKEMRNGKYRIYYGFIDTTGKVAIPMIYSDAHEFSDEGLARVAINDKYGFITKMGTEKIPCIYDDAFDFCEGYAEVNYGAKRHANDKYKHGGNWGLVNIKGDEVVPVIYEMVSAPRKNIH